MTISPLCFINVRSLSTFKLLDSDEQAIRNALLDNDKMYKEFLYLRIRCPEAGIRATIRHLIRLNKKCPKKFAK